MNRTDTAIISLVYLEHDLYRIVSEWKQVLPNVPIYLFADGCDAETRAGIERLVKESIAILPVPIAEQRRGYCNAMREAFTWMRSNTAFEKILTVDSDGCYPSSSVKAVYDANTSNAIACRLNRKEGFREYWYRWPYMKSEKYVMGFLFGLHLRDYSSGLRLLNLEQAYQTVILTKYSKWGFYMEFDVIWVKKYGPLSEVPVDYVPQPSKTFALRRMPDILWSELVALIKLKRDIILNKGAFKNAADS